MVKFGVMVSGQYTDGPPPVTILRGIAELIDELPFDSLWVSDHISFKNPIFEGIVALATFAAWTRRVRVGTSVLLLPLRHPSLVAKQVASVDVLSGGRVVLGVGVGGEGDRDYAAVQIRPQERGRRADEGIQALRTLWSGRPSRFTGTFFQFEDVVIDPAPTQGSNLPIWVGGRSEAALQRVGRLGDAWLAYMVSAERFGTSMSLAREAAASVGRPADAITGGLMLPTAVDDNGASARLRLREHLSRRYGRAFEDHVIARYCAAGTPEECCERIAEYAAAGVDHVVLMPSGQSSRLAAEITDFAEQLVIPMTMKESSDA